MRSLRIVLILAGKQLRILSRMPGILLVIFVPGIVMYSVFTKIFEGPAGVGRPFRAAVVDLDRTEASRRLIEALRKSNVKVIRTENEEPDGPALTVESARRQIRKVGQYRVALVIPEGFSKAPNVFSGEKHKGVQLIYDETQEMEANVIFGLIQMAAGRAAFQKALGILPAGSGGESGEEAAPHVLIKVERVGVSIRRMQIASKHTFLAGIVPMFLLFGATGAARSMLDEMQSGEMARLRAAPISPGHIIGGGLLSSVVVGMLQCYSMYVFAWLVFDVAIWEIGPGLFVLTLATCLAATAFGLMLGSLCQTSQQLDSIGTIVILAMSAVGGSMVPRFVMPPFMQKLGLFTINGWSYDGFIALIRAEGLPGILDECGVLAGIAAGCLMVGSVFLSRRLRAAPAS